MLLLFAGLFFACLESWSVVWPKFAMPFYFYSWRLPCLLSLGSDGWLVIIKNLSFINLRKKNCHYRLTLTFISVEICKMSVKIAHHFLASSFSFIICVKYAKTAHAFVVSSLITRLFCYNHNLHTYFKQSISCHLLNSLRKNGMTFSPSEIYKIMLKSLSWVSSLFHPHK